MLNAQIDQQTKGSKSIQQTPQQRPEAPTVSPPGMQVNTSLNGNWTVGTFLQLHKCWGCGWVGGGRGKNTLTGLYRTVYYQIVSRRLSKYCEGAHQTLLIPYFIFIQWIKTGTTQFTLHYVHWSIWGSHTRLQADNHLNYQWKDRTHTHTHKQTHNWLS